MGWPCFDPYMPESEQEILRSQMSVEELNKYKWNFENRESSISKILLLAIFVCYLKKGFRLI